jgi:hypothetical protein
MGKKLKSGFAFNEPLILLQPEIRFLSVDFATISHALAAGLK